VCRVTPTGIPLRWPGDSEAVAVLPPRLALDGRRKAAAARGRES
jgi:hypothetical protein